MNIYFFIYFFYFVLESCGLYPGTIQSNGQDAKDGAQKANEMAVLIIYIWDVSSNDIKIDC